MTQEQIQVTEIQALRMPAIAIRGLVMFPKMVLHFDVARQKSILALNQAMKGNQKIFLVTQKNSRVEEPGKEDLYTVGVVAKVKQILKAQGEAVRVVVEGKYRARMCELIRETPYYEVLCQEMPMEPVDENKQELVDAYMRVIKDLFEDYSYYAPKMPKELVINIIGSDDPIYLTEYLTQNLGFPLESKQQILEESNVRKRLELLSTLLHRESEVLKIEHSIAERVKDQVDRNQKEYYLREQLKAIHAELGDDDDPDQEIAQYYEKLRAMNPDEETKQKLSDEINKLSKMMYSSQEAMVSRNYLDTVFSLPWNQFTEDKLDVKAAEEKLNADHYGLQKVQLPQKMFGVFPHTLVDKSVPLLRGFDEIYWMPHSRHTEIPAADIRATGKLYILSSSPIAGVNIVSNHNGRQVFIFGHSEYEANTLADEYFRDLDKGLPIQLPYHYFPDDDPVKKPIRTWRSHGYLFYSNWLNYYVYQSTPYDLGSLRLDPLV